MNDDDLPLSELDARELLHTVGPTVHYRDRLELSYVDDRTILLVGYQVDGRSDRRMATGRVAWLLRQRLLVDGFRRFFGCASVEVGRDAWVVRAVGRDGDPAVHEGTGDVVDTVDDLYALFAWLKGARDVTRDSAPARKARHLGRQLGVHVERERGRGVEIRDGVHPDAAKMFGPRPKLRGEKP